jgi:C_GCAxxG_C_C family probable redox protein
MKKDHSKIAAELFCNGCNCSQAVLVAFAEDCGMDKVTAMKLSSSFGGGMGRLREVCGAVSGMFMVAGLLKGYVTEDGKEKKDAHYSLIQELAKEFTDIHGTYICKDLLGSLGKSTSPVSDPRTAEYYKVRPCVKFVITASEILDKRFFND